jgi:hypothetical protein
MIKQEAFVGVHICQELIYKNGDPYSLAPGLVVKTVETDSRQKGISKMKYCFLLMITMLLITVLPTTSFSQNVPKYLNPNEFAIGFSMSSENTERKIPIIGKWPSMMTEYNTITKYYGQIEYGLPNKFGIRFGGNVNIMKYTPYELRLINKYWSIPPSPGFNIGLYRIDKLVGKLDFWGNVDFGMGFVKVINDYNKDVAMETNATYLTPTGGLMIKIPIDKLLAVIPFGGIYYEVGMITTKSEQLDINESINDNDMGLVFGADIQIWIITIRGIAYYSNKYLTTTTRLNFGLKF